MQLNLFVFVILSILSSLFVMSIPILEIERSQRPRRDFTEKRQTKPRSGYIRFGKRQDPNAELLDLDQLLL